MHFEPSLDALSLRSDEPRLTEVALWLSQASTQPASSAVKAAGKSSPAKGKSSPAKKRPKEDDAMDVCVEEGQEEVAAGSAVKAKGRKRLLQDSDDSEAEEQPKRARRAGRGAAGKSLREDSSAEEEDDEVGPLAF